jgi:mannose-6-phosphate isomerase-like protein (cupin superfamily)
MKKTLLIPIIAFAIFSGACKNNNHQHDCNDHNHSHDNEQTEIQSKPMVVDIEEATILNDYYRKELWTGAYMQLVLMSLKPGNIIDLEVHHGHDQFIRIEKGEARVFMGKEKDNLSFEELVEDDWAILIPAGYWHTIENTGDTDLKLYTIYAPAEHPEGTKHKTYEEAKKAHDH